MRIGKHNNKNRIEKVRNWDYHSTHFCAPKVIERQEFLVDKQAEVPFHLGGYEDKVRVIHDGVTNRFTFVHLGQMIMLNPLSPRKVHENQKKMKINREVERKIKSKLKKKKRENKDKKEKKKGKIKEVRRVLFAKRKPLFALATNMLLNASPSLNDLPIGFLICAPKGCISWVSTLERYRTSHRLDTWSYFAK
ncbi:hypothetical protein CR513_38657, partial [Mucuna pruriens]